jgi:hypothetical protein
VLIFTKTWVGQHLWRLFSPAHLVTLFPVVDALLT